jgi:glutamine synthetase
VKHLQIATPTELAAFLDAYPDIQAVQILITDPSGVTRGKSVRREELPRIFETGRPVAGSILGLDITGEDVDATGLVWDTGDADMTERPIAGSLRVAPWLAAPTAQLMLAMFDRRGQPPAADPRHALVRAVERFAARGLSPVVACEIEFYLLKEEGGGRLVPAGGGRVSERQKIDAYSLTRLDDLAPVFDDVYRAATAQGLPAETLMSEYSPGQFEITLHYRDEALRAVDEAVMFKHVLRGVAGLIVGLGARPGPGCTSGHGVCGIGRGSPRSLAATAVFMATAIATVFVTRHILGM